MSTCFPIPRSDRETIVVLADGQTEAAFTFGLYEAADLAVFVKAPGVELYERLAESEYTVTVAAYPGPGTLALAAPRPAGTLLRMQGRRVHERLTDVTQAGVIRAAALEREFDQVAVVLQELRRDVDDPVQNVEDIAAAVTAATAAATDAAAARDAAVAARLQVDALFDDFDDRYLGAKAAEPTTDNDGDPLQPGALYFATHLTPTRLRQWDGAQWLDVGAGAGVIRDADIADDAAIAATKLAYRHPAAAAVVRSVQSILQEGLSARDFDASPSLGTSGYDATLALQRLAAECAAAGYQGVIPPGDYPIAASIVFDETASTGQEDPRGSLVGHSAAGTRILPNGAFAALDIRGGPAAGVHSSQRFGGFKLIKPTYPMTGIGLKIDNVAWASFQDIFISGFEYGIQATDFLSSHLVGVHMRINTYGLTASYADFSRPNALTLQACNFGGNYEYAALLTGCSLFKMIGGAVEGNGRQGVGPARGGLFFVNSGDEGVVAASLDTVYFELNAGHADIKIDHTANTCAYTIESCTFNRISDTDFVPSNIVVEQGGSADIMVNLSNCGFKGFNTYVESAARPYVSVPSGARVNDRGGNLFHAAVAYVDLARYGQATRAGRVNADGTGALLPRGWSSRKVEPGVYEITHNLGLSASGYAVMATTDTGGGQSVWRVFQAANLFNVVIANDAWALADSTFNFVLHRP